MFSARDYAYHLDDIMSLFIGTKCQIMAGKPSSFRYAGHIVSLMQCLSPILIIDNHNSKCSRSYHLIVSRLAAEKGQSVAFDCKRIFLAPTPFPHVGIYWSVGPRWRAISPREGLTKDPRSSRCSVQRFKKQFNPWPSSQSISCKSSRESTMK